MYSAWTVVIVAGISLTIGWVGSYFAYKQMTKMEAEQKNILGK